MTNAVAVGLSQDNNGGAVAPFVAGKNKIINGDFGIWQRGTSGFPFGGAFNADRWQAYFDSGSATYAITQQPLPAGSIVGVDSPYCWQMNQSVAGSGGTVNVLYTKIENVQTFAGQTATLSFYAKSDATRTALAPTVTQSFGTGGSADVTPTVTAVTGNPTNLTISWQRFVYNVTVPSISGKTIGTGSYLLINIRFPINTTQVNQVVGVQLEAGSTATPFTTATGTLQGELAACQRYYVRFTSTSAYASLSNYVGANATNQIYFPFCVPVSMRSAVQTVDWGGNLGISDGVNVFTNISSINPSGGVGTYQTLNLNLTTSPMTQFRPYRFTDNGAGTAFIGIGCEL
jgi:hypothetical protein